MYVALVVQDLNVFRMSLEYAIEGLILELEVWGIGDWRYRGGLDAVETQRSGYPCHEPLTRIAMTKHEGGQERVAWAENVAQRETIGVRKWLDRRLERTNCNGKPLKDRTNSRQR